MGDDLCRGCQGAGVWACFCIVLSRTVLCNFCGKNVLPVLLTHRYFSTICKRTIGSTNSQRLFCLLDGLKKKKLKKKLCTCRCCVKTWTEFCLELWFAWHIYLVLLLKSLDFIELFTLVIFVECSHELFYLFIKLFSKG